MRGNISKSLAARACATALLGAAAWLLSDAECGAVTNSLSGTGDFRTWAEIMELRNTNSIRRDKNGAVEFIGKMYMTDDELVLISREPSIRALSCIWPKCNEQGMSALGQMTNLTSLTIVRSNALPTVSKLTQLRKLHLMCTRMKPADLPCLIQLTNLEDLEIWGAWEMGTNSISAMTNFPRLKRLDIGGGGDSCAKTIADFRTNGYENATNWDGWRDPEVSEFTALTNLTSLEELRITDFTDFGDEQLRLLNSLPKLKSLELKVTAVSENWSNIVSHFPALTNAVAWLPDPVEAHTIEAHEWTRKQ